jgi:Fe-S-cluster containining protein
VNKEPAEHICAACLRVNGKVCCQTAPGEKLATLLLADMERIEEATGLPRHRFVEREDLDPAERLAYETVRPLYRGVFVGNVRWGLKARKGACVFLEPGRGCSLPPEAKPLACILYPLDFDLAGEPTLLDAPHCLALEQATGPEDLMEMLGTSLRKLARLRKQALEEAVDHATRVRRMMKRR